MPLINACLKGKYYGGTLGKMKNFEVLQSSSSGWSDISINFPSHSPPYTRQINFITKLYWLGNANICSTWIASVRYWMFYRNEGSCQKKSPSHPTKKAKFRHNWPSPFYRLLKAKPIHFKDVYKGKLRQSCTMGVKLYTNALHFEVA